MTADIAHIDDELNELSSLCEGIDEGVERGWAVSSWLVSERALDVLIDTYRALLLVVDDKSEVAEQLAHDGIDLTDLLIDAESAEETITRADLCELAAGAWMLAVDRVSLGFLLMPNVPKGERSGSAQGVDAIATTFREGGSETGLDDGELVLLCSAKHSIADAGDLRRKLVASVAEEALTQAYLTSQLRLLHGWLQLRGHSSPERVFLVLSDFPDPDHVRVVAVGATDDDLSPGLLDGKHLLPEVVPAGVYHLRALTVPGLRLLHERVP